MTTYRDFHRRSLADRAAFWREEAALIDWQTPFDEVLDYRKPPFAHWFVGGRTNLCHNAIDRHLATRSQQLALLFLSTETGTSAKRTAARVRGAASGGVYPRRVDRLSAGINPAAR